MIESNISVEWQKYLDKKMTSNFEVIRIEQDKNTNVTQTVLAFVRVKSSKRILNFEDDRLIEDSTVKYFLDLPDMLFLVNCSVNSECKKIFSSEVHFFGLDENNQLLILPLTNINDGGELCCDLIGTEFNESNEYDEKVLFKHLKSQVNEFFHEKFNYELSDNIQRYIGNSTINEHSYEFLCHSIWKQWSQDTLQNKKFDFIKYTARETIYFEEYYVTDVFRDDDFDDDDFDEDDFDEDEFEEDEFEEDEFEEDEFDEDE